MSKQSILVVEDEKDIAEAIHYALEMEGFEVVIAGDGEEALEKISKEKPDLVILDILLPKIDGWEVLSTIRRKPKTQDLPVIILTVKTTEASKLCGYDLGADDYMNKPFSVNELLARIKAVLKRSQLMVEKREAAGRLPKIAVWKKGSKEVFVDQEDILYVKAAKNYTYIYTSEDSFLTNLKMYELEEKLSSDIFMRIHRSYFVNLRYVYGLVGEGHSFKIRLRNDEGTTLPISRFYIKELRKRMGVEK
ncbi:MAG: response regulator transcription factor [Actinobacteria bacterium]|nr:response regulator transcription factor [Actinomycetota bacterium]